MNFTNGNLGRILFLVPYPPDCAPSQRYRFEQYLKILRDRGFEWDLEPFLDLPTWDILYQPGHFGTKVAGYCKGLFNRFLLLFKMRQYHWVFLHREALPLMPPVYEWFLAKVLHKKIIFDFDDAIWIRQRSPVNPGIKPSKNSRKTFTICKLSEKVSVGNTYLAGHASRFNNQVTVVPTTIDTLGRHNLKKRHHSDGPLTLGWTGTHSTLPYLEEVIPVLRKLEKRYAFRFLVIADRPLHADLRSLDFRKWDKQTEVADLLAFDIGLMPLPDTDWAKGKCGLKALQYMALGIPAVVSPVGVNHHLVEHGVQGFHCNNQEQWYSALEQLIGDTSVREQMGRHGRMKVEKYYSVKAHTENFLALFKLEAHKNHSH